MGKLAIEELKESHRPGTTPNEAPVVQDEAATDNLSIGIRPWRIGRKTGGADNPNNNDQREPQRMHEVRLYSCARIALSGRR